jgi:hypothetical protein
MAEEKKDGDDLDIADTVGPAANYAIAKNFFNFEGLGPIDADIPLVCELELFVTTTTIVVAAGNKSPINLITGLPFSCVVYLYSSIIPVRR